jgi:hypothetical protein
MIVFVFFLLLLRFPFTFVLGQLTQRVFDRIFSELAGVVSCLLCPQEKDLRGLTCPLMPPSQGGPSIIPARIDRTT